jgi:hypothetical protein
MKGAHPFGQTRRPPSSMIAAMSLSTTTAVTALSVATLFTIAVG